MNAYYRLHVLSDLDFYFTLASNLPLPYPGRDVILQDVLMSVWNESLLPLQSFATVFPSLSDKMDNKHLQLDIPGMYYAGSLYIVNHLKIKTYCIQHANYGETKDYVFYLKHSIE